MRTRVYVGILGIVMRATPAMEAGVSDHVWELDEIAKVAS
jgi:hypothetical protein